MLSDHDDDHDGGGGGSGSSSSSSSDSGGDCVDDDGDDDLKSSHPRWTCTLNNSATTVAIFEFLPVRRGAKIS